MLQNAVDHFAVMFAQIFHRTADALGHKAASLNRRIAVHDPLAQLGHTLAGGPKQVAHGVLVIGVHADAHGGAVFQQLQGTKDQALQNALMLCLQNPAGSGLYGHAGQLCQFIPPGFAKVVTLRLKSAQHVAEHLPHINAELLKLGPGLLHARLKALIMRVAADKLGFFAQVAGLAVLCLGLGQFCLGLRLQLFRFARELLHTGLSLDPGLLQHLLPFGIGCAKNLACAFLGPGAHPSKIVLLLLVLGAFTEQGFLHGVKLLRCSLALAHEDGAPFFAQLV